MSTPQLTSQSQSVLTWLQSQNSNGATLSPAQLAQFTSELQSQLNSLSVKVPGGTNSVTLLYSGQLGSGSDAIPAWKVAEQIGTNSNGAVTTIGQTEVGSLMNNPLFADALNNALGKDPVAVNNLLNGYTDTSGKSVTGLWSTTSERLALSASGDVRTLTPFATGDKVFAQTELPALLENPAVTSINGVPKAIYQQVYDTALASGGTAAADTAVLNAVNYSSAALTNNLGVAIDSSGNVTGVASGNLLEGSGLGKLSIPAGTSGSITSLASDYQASLENPSLATTAIKQGGIALGEAEMALLSQGNTVARLGMTTLGVTGGVLAGAVTVYTVSQINDALNSGDTATANALARQLVSSWTGGLAGATAAGSLSAELLSPLLAGGPVGGAIYVVLVGAASLAGGYWGSEAVNSLLSNLNFNPLGSSSTTTIDEANFTQITKFGNGSILTQPIDGYTDANGMLHIGVFGTSTSGDSRQTTLQVPDGNGGYTVVSAKASGTTLTQWAGQPGDSAQVRQIQTTSQSTDPETGKVIPATINLYQGTSSQRTSTTSINADGSKTQIDYPDPADPNVNTITTFSAAGVDSNGNVVPGVVTGTCTITQAVDNTPDSPTFGQPVANTYNITNTDASGTIVSTGQRGVNPADGSYQDTIIGSATAANPGGTISVSQTDSQGTTTSVVSQTGVLTLSNEVSAFNDAYSLIKAIQSGQPLPIVGSGLRLTNDLNGGNVPALSMAGNSIGVITGIEGLANALKTGDVASGVVAGANAFVQGVQLYNAVVYGGDVINAAAGGLGGVLGAASAASDAIPYLNVANDLAHGNYAGAIGDSVGIYVAETLAEAEVGAEIGAAAGPIGAVVGFVLGSVLGDLFGDDPPPPWGTASAGWGSNGTYKISAVGDQGGDTTAYNVLSNLVNGLQNIATTYNNLGQPGLQLGIIPERLGSLNFNSNQFHINTVDSATGQAINPNLYYDTNGNVSSSSTYDGTGAYFQSLGAYYSSNALARQAIAPEWEVQTAQQQAANGLSNAGLSETQRAANVGELAAPIAAGATTETWNPIALDFGGGLAITGLTGSTVQFNVDGTDNLDANLTGAKDTQYLHQTAWLNKTDGFLVLDENMNGTIDNGEEMFSDSQVAAGYRGISSLATYDANGDGVINAGDPVFAQMGIWIDAQGMGKMTPANYHSLASLGITSLNYRLGTYTKTDGSVHEMGTLSLQADTLGTSYTAVASGIQLTTTNGQVTIDVTQLNNLSSVQANEVGFTTNEDVPAVIQVRGNGSNIQGLLDTDSVSNAPNAVLQLSSVQNAQGGTVSYNAQAGTVTFTPTTGFSGTAGFDYTINAGAYGTATAHVQVSVAQVDHPPVITGDTLQQIPIYGYVPSTDGDGITTYSPSYTPGYGYADANGGGGYLNRSTPVSYQTNPDAGTLSVTDQDFPLSSLSWSIVNQAQHGTASVDANGNWNFSNGAAIGGNDAFVVQVTDPLGGKSQYTVSVPLPAAPSGGGTDGGGGDGASDSTDSSDSSDSSDGSADGAGDGGSGDGGGDGGGGDGGGGDPLVLDLKGTGFHFKSVNDSNVFFQQAGDGLRHQTAWFTGGNGVLAFDKMGNGIIQDSSQIDFYKQVPGATNDLQALQILAKGAGQLNASNPIWSKLGAWVDSNNDGVCEAGEFETLTQLGITSINFTDTPAFSVQNGVVIHEMATFTYANGATSNMAEVTLPFSNKVLNGAQINQVAQGSLANPITVGDGNNLVLGNAGDNAISTGNGNNVVITGAGNDLIQVGNGNNSIQSGDGNDLVVAGDGNNTILLGAGPKTVVVGKGNNMVVGGSGNNIIMAGQGNNVLYAGSGNSVVFAEDGSNTLVGGIGRNELIAGNGNNTFTDGGGRADMTAGTGSNTFTVTNALDTITVAAPVAGKAAGVNTVKTSVNWTLGANQQILWGSGNATLTLTGNNLGDEIIGNGAADTLIGGTGNDTLADSGGAATMIGGGGNDTFIVSNAASTVQEVPNSGSATIKTSVNYTLPANVQTLLGTGNAALTLTGGSQDGVTIKANNANDTLIAGSGIATLIGGTGNDTFIVNNTQDVVQAQAGGSNTIDTSVSFTNVANVQNLIGTGSADLTLTGNGQGDTVQANAGNDTLVAGNGHDTLVGGTGNDSYRLGNSAETVLLGSGQSTVTGGNGNSRIEGNASGSSNIALGDGSNQINLAANNQANTVTLGNGSNAVSLGQGNNTIIAGNGADQITGGSGNNVVQLGSGANSINLANGNNQITTAEQAGTVDTIQLGGGNNTIRVGDGSDAITAGNGSNTIQAGNGANTVNLGQGRNQVSLGNGNSQVTASDVVGSQDAITVGSGNNTVTLAQGDDTMVAGNGANTLKAGDGTDSVTVGNGNNAVTLGNGNDTVALGSGSNQVTLGNGANKVTASDVAGSQDTVTLGLGSNTVTLAQGNDKVVVGNGNNAITAGNGNDQIQVGTGSNTIQVGNGADQITTGSGTNAIHVGTGQDTVQNHGGTDSLYFAPGVTADKLTFAQSGSDLLITEAQTGGSVRIVGGYNNLAAGIAQFILGNGAYQVQLDNASYQLTAGNGVDTITAGNGANTLILGNGNDVVKTGSGNDVLTLGNGNNQITTGDVAGSIESIQAGGGNNTVILGNGADTVRLGNGTNSITGGQGNDQINLGAGSNIVTLGNGSDTVTGQDAAGATDVITLGSGTDTVTLANGNNKVSTADLVGTVDTIQIGNGSNTISVGQGNDRITLGNGTNTVRAGNGANTLNLGAGTNQVTLGNGANRITAADAAGTQSSFTLGSGNNTVQLAQGNNAVTAGNGANAITAGNGNNTVGLGSGVDTVTLGNGNNKVSSADAVGVKDTIQVGNGSNTISVGQGNDTITAGNGANGIVGGNGADTVALGTSSNSLTLGNGNDSVIAQDVTGSANTVNLGNGNNAVTLSNGNDSVTTGNGNSQVLVGNGNNTIAVGNGANQITTGSGVNAIHVGTGNDTIINHGGTDSLYFAPGVSAGGLSFSQSGNDLLITESTNGGTVGGTVRIVGGYSNPAAAISQFIAGNGSYTARLDNGNYNFSAGNGSDAVYGGNGADKIALGNGNDVVQLGSGNDSVSVGSGSDLIVLNDQTGGADQVTAGDGNDLIQVGNGNDQITTGKGSSQIYFGSGTDAMTTGDGNNFIAQYAQWCGPQSAATGNATISVGNGQNTIVVGNGNDSVSAGNGSNWIALGSGNNQVRLGSGSNWVSLGQGNSTLSAQDAAGQVNVIQVGTGKDSITLGNGNNLVNTYDLAGGADTITVGNGNNDIDAGQGNDVITAGNGSNAIDAGNGNLSVTLGSGSHGTTLSFRSASI